MPRLRKFCRVDAASGVMGEQKITDGIDDMACLLFGELRIDWDSYRFFRGAFALRQRSHSISEVRKALLEVHGHRVIYLCTDALRFQSQLELIAICSADHILIKDVPVRYHRR